MKDLTKGPIFKTILIFAIPIFFGNLFQLFYSLTDTRIVGTYLGDAALAAVGGSAILCNLLINFVNGMTLGFSVPMARFYGGKHLDKLRKAFALSVWMGLLLCTLIVTFSQLFMDELMVFMKIEESLRADARSYCVVLLCGVFFSFAYNLGASVLRALGNSLTPLLMLVCSSILNVVMDIYFIDSLHLGVFGAGLATVIAQAISAMLCLIYLWKKYPLLHFTMEDLKPERGMLKELLASGCSMAFMGSLVQSGTLVLQTSINGLGQNIVVAHTSARKVTEIFMMVFSIVGSAMCTFVGQNVGAGKYDRVRKGLLGAMAFEACWAIIAVLIAFTAAPQLVTMITGTRTEEVLETAKVYLRFNASFYTVVAGVTLFRNVLQGMGSHIVPIVSSSLELVGKVVLAKVMVPLIGYWGVILAEPVSWAIMVIPLAVQLLRSPYLKRGATAAGRNWAMEERSL